MGETNKRHNRKIWRSCPVCKGRVVLGHRNQDWWVYCEDDVNHIPHIPQRFFPYAHEAIDEWNVKANKRSNADRIRSMTDEELADWIVAIIAQETIYSARKVPTPDYAIEMRQRWLEWLRQECAE